MKKMLSLLLYVTGFIQGHFTQALKQVLNVESVKYLDKDEDGNSIMKLDDFLSHLRNTFGSEIQQLYMTLMFLKVIKSNQLLLFFKQNHQGEKSPVGYGNLFLIRDLINKKLLHLGMKYKSDEYQTSLVRFVKLLGEIPTGKKKVLQTLTCKHCNRGFTSDGLDCYVCKGTGEVQQWAYLGQDITDDYIAILQQQLSEIAPIVAEILDDYIQYYFSNYMYDSAFYINKERTGNHTFDYDGNTFTVPFYCDLKGTGKLPDDKIKVSYDYEGFQFTIPLVVLNESVVEKPDVESRFVSTGVDEDTESMKIEESVVTKKEDGVTTSEESKVKYTYKRKDGKKVVGYGKPDPDWMKYYKGTANSAQTLYFNAKKYERDEVRQAYSNLVGLPKSNISIATITD